MKNTGKDKGFSSRNRAFKVMDVMYSASDAQAVKDIASFPWSSVVGSNITVNNNSVATGYDCTPAAMVISYRHTLGCLDSQVTNDDILERNAAAFFNSYTQGFTAGVNFQAADVFMALMAAASIAGVVEEGRRALGLVHKFSQSNSYYGKKVFEACGFDWDDWTSGLADFRSSINVRLAELNEIAVIPKDLAIFKRWSAIASYIFTDTNSFAYSTAMIPRLESCLKYSAVTANTGTCLEWKTVHANNGSKLTRAAYLAILDDLISSLDDDDVREMFGAIRRVYTPDSLYKFAPFVDTYETEIYRDDLFAAAVHNMEWVQEDAGVRAIGYLPPSLSADAVRRTNVPVYQQDGKIRSGVFLHAIDRGRDMCRYYCTKAFQTQKFIDIYDHMISPENMLDISIMSAPIKAIVYWSSSDQTFASQIRGAIICRSEVYVGNFIYYNDDKGIFRYDPVPPVATCFENGEYNLFDSHRLFALISHLDSHPLIDVATGTDDNETGPNFLKLSEKLGEIDRFTLVGKDEFMRMNERAMWKMVYLPPARKSTTA